MLQTKNTIFGTQKPLPFAHHKNNMNDVMALADRIRIILSDLDGPEYGKQARLAEIARCGRPVVNHWLSHKQETISSKHAMNIAAGLGYRVEWLMEGRGPRRKDSSEIDEEVRTEQPPPKEATFMVQLSEEEMQVIMAFRKADSMDRAVMRHLFLKKTEGKGNS
jgi:hypothetical protein